MTKTATQANASVESLLGRAADEFTQQLNTGEDPDIEEYAARYPQIADAIRQVFPALRTLRPAPPDRDLPAQQTGDDHRLGDYRIIREIGRGGMGIVYDAQQISLGRRVALKVLPFAAVLDERQLQRFKNEAHAAAQLHHTNIVPVFSVGCERGVHYYAMQFIEGPTLAEVIAELAAAEPGSAGPPSPAETPANTDATADSAAARLPDSPPNVASGLSPGRSSAALDAIAPNRSTRTPDFFRSVANLGVQAAEALEHAHEFGIVHRDIKPSNLLLDQRGNLWITDFGLARLESNPDLTMTGDILGTLRYMSPEQAAGKNLLLDHRTDIYSLGVTLYELLTLRPAFDGRDRQELLRKIADHDPRQPRRLNPAIPPDLETIVLKATAKEPHRRYASAREFAKDLDRFLEDKPIRAKRPTLIERSAKWCRRHTAACAFGVTLLALTVIGLSIGTALLWREQARTLDALNDSQEARRAEEVQRRIAEENEAVAKAVNDFLLYDLLAVVSPSSRAGRGKDVLMRDVLDQAAKSIDRESRAGGRFEKMPVVEASIRATLGSTYANLGEYATAEPLVQRALLLRREELGEEHWSTLRSMFDLAYVYADQGRYEESATLHAKTLEIRKRVVGEENRGTLRTMNSLASLYMKMGRYAEAEPLFVKTLEIRKRFLGEEHRDTLGSMTNLANLLVKLGRDDEAELLYVETLALKRRLLGEEDPYTLICTNGLAIVYAAKGDYDKAEPLFVKVLEGRRRVMGEEHPATLSTLSSLATLYGDQGKTDDARPLVRALKAAKQRQANRPEASAGDKNNFAWFLLTCEPVDLRDPETALRLAQGACAMTDNANPLFLDTLALAQHLTGDTPAAIETQQKALRLLPQDAAGRSDYEAALARFEAALEEPPEPEEVSP